MTPEELAAIEQRYGPGSVHAHHKDCDHTVLLSDIGALMAEIRRLTPDCTAGHRWVTEVEVETGDRPDGSTWLSARVMAAIPFDEQFVRPEEVFCARCGVKP